MSRIESLGDLRPGDVMFGPIGGAAGVLVGAGQLILGEGWSVGPLKIRHVGIVVQAADGTPARLVQAMPRGAEEVDMHAPAHWTTGHAYVRLAQDYGGQADRAAELARVMVGTPYSFLSYAALAAWKFGLGTPRLEGWINRRSDSVPPVPLEAICSVLVDQAWSMAGKLIMSGVPHQCVTPGALASRMLLDMPGAQWSFPHRSSPVL